MEPPDREYEKLYAAQQALSWALDPTGFKAPYDVITGITGSGQKIVRSVASKYFRSQHSSPLFACRRSLE